MRNKQLMDGKTKICLKCEVSSITFNNISTLNKTVNFQNLFSKYLDILKPKLLILKFKHDIQHFIFTEGLLAHQKTRK